MVKYHMPLICYDKNPGRNCALCLVDKGIEGNSNEKARDRKRYKWIDDG